MYKLINKQSDTDELLRKWMIIPFINNRNIHIWSNTPGVISIYKDKINLCKTGHDYYFIISENWMKVDGGYEYDVDNITIGIIPTADSFKITPVAEGKGNFDYYNIQPFIHKVIRNNTLVEDYTNGISIATHNKRNDISELLTDMERDDMDRPYSVLTKGEIVNILLKTPHSNTDWINKLILVSNKKD